METKHLELLQTAIADVGGWNWWGEGFPERFQVEFVATQFWLGEGGPGDPPVSQRARRFLDPVSVSFLSGRGAEEDWPRRMAADQLEPFVCDCDRFHLVDGVAMERCIREAAGVETVLGCPPLDPAFFAAPARLVFWAGPLGLAVAAREMLPVAMTGALTGEELETANEKWWAYWQEYWKRRESSSPLPRDYGCEVTIPAGRHRLGKERNKK